MNASLSDGGWRTLLERAFPGARIDVTDESHRHAGHLPPGSPSRGTHAYIRIVHAGFEGVPLPQRHRMVYRALGFGTGDLHALRLKTLTPSEADRPSRS